MKVLKLCGTLLALVVALGLQTDQAQGQSIAQRRLHPGTYQHRSTQVVQPRVFYNVVPQVEQSRGTTGGYRSFSFEPGNTAEGTTEQATELPVFRAPRTSSRSKSNVGSIAHRRLHPGSN